MGERQPDPDLRVLFDEIADPRLQPLGGKAGAARDEQVAPLRLRRHQSRRARDCCKSALDLTGVDAAGSRQRCAAGVSGENLNAKEVLEVLNAPLPPAAALSPDRRMLLLAEMVTHRYPLEAWRTAMRTALRRGPSGAIKVAFRP